MVHEEDMAGLGQIVALVIFLVMFAVIVWGKIHRYIPALIAAVLIVFVVFLGIERSTQSVVNVFNLGQLVQASFWIPAGAHAESRGINWQTIIFIAGMMTMVEGLGNVGFFRWLCLFVAKQVKYKIVPILVVFMLLSGFLAMFIDSITVLLFLATITVELARLLKFDPIPVIIAEIFASNVGGSATMSGDPPNIIIGTAFGFTFMDFVTNTGLIAWIGMLVTLVLFFFLFRGVLNRSHEAQISRERNHAGHELATDGGTPVYPQPREAITNIPLFLANTGIFILAVALLVTHAETGLSVAIIGVIAAVLTLLVAGKSAPHIMKKLDWRTLLFFIGLFIVVGGLEETGVLAAMAKYIEKISGGSPAIVIAIILWFSAFASAIIDNIPFAATMVPVLSSLVAQSPLLNLQSMSWALALGTDIGGNATPIGASANVVGTAIAEKEGYPVSWGRFMKYALPAMLLVVAICHIYIVIRYL